MIIFLAFLLFSPFAHCKQATPCTQKSGQTSIKNQHKLCVLPFIQTLPLNATTDKRGLFVSSVESFARGLHALSAGSNWPTVRSKIVKSLKKLQENLQTDAINPLIYYLMSLETKLILRYSKKSFLSEIDTLVKRAHTIAHDTSKKQKNRLHRYVKQWNQFLTTYIGTAQKH